MKRKITAILLTLCMMLQLPGLTAAAAELGEAITGTDGQEVSAESTYNVGEDVFVFSAAKYVLSESDESYDVVVERAGNAEAPAEVVFKAIDAMAVYGKDYTILGSDGSPLEKAEGTVLSQGDMLRLTAAQEHQTGEAGEQPQTADQTGADLFEKRNVLLGIEDTPELAERKAAADEVQTAVTELNDQLFEMAGVSGVLHFDAGEREKTITIVPVDDEVGAADKTVLMALLSTTEGNIAPNATASVVIMDDEPYAPPVFEMAQSRVTLDADNPRTELTITRLSGENYYSTVLVSTYSMTAQREVDFTPLDNEQVVFAPGEVEKTVPVEALDFSYTGDFGVRLMADESCRIGEADRTIVHIAGALSQTREPEEQPEEAQLLALAANNAPESNEALASPAAEKPWSGVLGSDTLHVKHLTIRPSYEIPGVPVKSELLNEVFTFGSGYFYSVSLNMGFADRMGHKPSRAPDKVHIVFTIKLRQNFTKASPTIAVDFGEHKNSIYTVTDQEQEIVLETSYKDIQFFQCTRKSGSFEADMKIKDIYYTFGGSSEARIMAAPTVTSAPYYDLIINSGNHDTKTIKYDPPKIQLQTDDGNTVDRFFPSDEMVNIIYDREDAEENGLYLAYVTIASKEVTPGKNPDWGTSVRVKGDSLRFNLDEALGKIYYPPSNGVYYFYPEFRTKTVSVRLRNADDGSYIQSSKGSNLYIQTGSIIKALGRAANGTAITGYAIYVSDGSGWDYHECKLFYVYRNPDDSSKLGSDEHDFVLPCLPDGMRVFYILPLTEYQGLTVKPHPSTKKETITDPDTGEKITYAGRVYLNGAFNSGDGTGHGDDTLVADETGQVYVSGVNSNQVVTLRAMAPKGYITEWVNGTLDFNEDGIIDNENSGSLSQSKVDSLYIPVYGDQLIYQVSQVNPKYYYRFTKFDPSRLLNGKTRTGYVMYDTRNILDYNGKEAKYKDLTPLAGATVTIGDNVAVTDENGRYEIPMDGVPDAVRVSAMVRSDMGDFITHIQSNVENNITIPFYDTFEPTGEITATYKNEGGSLARGINILDNTLTVSLKVNCNYNGLYIKNAYFYIADNTGKKIIDCNERAESGDSNYQVSYIDGETYGTATLKMNPKADMLSGYQIYVQFEDQNGTTHRAMNTGYRFLEVMELGTFILGAIGSPKLADGVESSFDLLGSPLLQMDMGQISGFHVSGGTIGPEAKLYDERGNVMNQYDAALYSYEWRSSGYGNWTAIGSKDSSKARANGENGEGSNGESSAVEHPKNALFENGVYISKMNDGSANNMENGLPKTESDKNQPPKNGAKQEEPQKPKGAELGNDNKGITAASDYSFDLSPSVQFDLVTTTRPTTDAQGNQVYKHYFEEMRLAVGIDFEVAAKIEITFPIGISLMVKPSLGGSAAAIYYMRTNYGDDKFWNKRPIEYSAETFGLFDDFDGNMYRAGYIELNPIVKIAVGVKVAVVEVDVEATITFDMDFKFDSVGTRTHGSMKYDVSINVLLLKFKVYSKSVAGDEDIYLFGERNGIDSGLSSGITQASARMSRAINDVLTNGDITVEAADRSYLSQRSGWGEGGGMARLFSTSNVLDEDNPADALLQNGVMPGDQMASAMLDTDVMFVAFVDDDPSRGDNDRGVVKYSYTNSDGTWAKPVAIEDDGTLDTEPVVYDMGDSLLVAWLTANRTFDGTEDSLDTVAAQLNALDVHAAFFDKAAKTFGQVFEVTKTTDTDHTAEGSIAITAQENGGARIYYTKTQYSENPENVNELIATSSVIAYRDYVSGAWSEELTPTEESNIQAQGGDPEDYAQQLYGQHFADTRVNGQWMLITDMEADYRGGDWAYFAYVADADGSLETSTDRRVFLLFDAHLAPVCVTPEAGAYSDLQFCYSGSELLLFFKTDRANTYAGGQDTEMGGVSYINLSELFEKQGYEPFYDDTAGYYQMITHGTEGGQSKDFPYQPEDAVILEGIPQNYTVFADQGGRVYVMWSESTVNDDGTNGIQIYTSVYNGNPDWIGGDDLEAVGTKWSYPVLMTSPLNGNYNSFTAQSIIGDGIAFVAKRTTTEDVPQLVFHLRAPYATFSFNEQMMDTKYVYADQPILLTAQITNVGLMAQKAERNEQAGNTWTALPGTYQITFKTLVDGEETEIIATQKLEAVWNVGTTLSASCDWMLEEIPDNMDLCVSVTDVDTGEEICSVSQPVVKASELDLGQMEVDVESEAQAEVSFMLSNSGNIPTTPTAVIYATDQDGNQTELSRTSLSELQPLENAAQSISVEIPEGCLTIADTQGTLELWVEIWDGDELSYSATASGSIAYNAAAMADVAQVENLEIEQTTLRMRSEETATLTAKVTPASALERNRVVYVSSDEAVAAVDADGNVTAVSNGTATITAYAVPKIEWVSVQPNGTTDFDDMRGAIPESMVKTQEIAVTVSSGGSSSSGSSSSSKPSVSSSGEGTVAANRDGSVTMTPDEGSRVTGVTVNGKRVSIPKDGKLTGLKATDKVEVTFEPIRTVELSGYTDLAANAWYTEAVGYVMSYGLFNGTSDTTFAPNTSMTRGMLATVLHRADGLPDGELPDFDDVPTGQYYTEAVGWAAERGIVTGYGDGTFGPDDPITREQLAVMLWRYAGKPTPPNLLLNFTDADQAGDYAQDALRWAVEQGIINGKGGGILDPKGQATRAEVAAMLTRYLSL